MPQFLPILAFIGAEEAGATIVEAAIITLVASVAVAVYEKQVAIQEARQSYLNSLQDRLIQVRSGVATRGYVLGTVRLGGALQYIQTLGTKKEALDQVVAFANNECDIVDYILGSDFIQAGAFPGTKYGNTNFQPASDVFTVTGPTASVTLQGPAQGGTLHVTWRQAGIVGTATGTIASGNGATITGLPTGSSSITVSYQTADSVKLRGQFKTGSVVQTVTDWAGYANPEWDSTHPLLGVAHLRTLYIWDQNIYQQGAPQATAVLLGKTCDGYPFYDPRDGSNPASTTNPALLAAWWMTFPRFMGGMGIPADWIDYTTVAAAANICDELVTVRNLANTGYETIKRYECDTYLDTAVSPIDNLNTILSSMAGTRAFTSGKYKVFAGAFRPAAMTLTDNDINGKKPISVNTANVEDEPPNIVTATISDANQQWQQSNPNPVRNDSYVTADGYENPLDLTLNATTDTRRARYLMGIALERGRPAFGLSLSIAGIGETLGLYDTVQLNLSNRPQYAGRTYEILSMVDNWDGTFDISLSETKSTTYVLDPDTFTPTTPVIPTDNSYLWDPPEPTGFLIGSITPTTLPDGTAVARVNLLWDPIPPAGNTPGAHFDIRYRTTGGQFIDGGSVTGDATATTLTAALQDGEQYQFELRFVNGIGASSDWVDAYTGISGTPLPTPLSLRLSASSQIFRVPQTGNALPLSITLQAVRTGGLTAAASWSTNPSVTLGGSGDTRTLSFANDTADSVQVTLTVVQTAVTYVDTVTIVKVYDGANSTPDFTAPPTPTGLTVQSFLVDLFLTWDAPTYTFGGGHDATIIYGKQINVGDPQPTFADAAPLGSSSTNSFAFPTTTGATWAFWIKFQTRAGVRSNVPAGGTNGVQGTTGLIGGVNIGDLAVTAAKLADGSITATKLAANAVDATKLASGLQAITVVASTLPSTNVGNVVYRVSDGKLYHWNGTTYTAQTAAADIAGQLTDAQLAGIAAAKLTGTLTTTQIGTGTIQTGNLAAASVTSAAIAADTITANNIAANAIGASELAAGSVVAGKIAANAVTAGTIAAAAVNAAQIAAGAISTDKLLVTGRGAALNDDPACADPSAWTLWSNALPNFVTISDGVVGTTAARSISGGGGSYFNSRLMAVDPTKTYRVRGWARNVGGNGVYYLGVFFHDQNGAEFNNYWNAASAAIPTAAFVLFTGYFGAGTPNPIFSGSKFMSLSSAMNWTGTTGYMEAQDLRIEEVVGSSLIVDGGITATKLAANSIAVGSAAIQNGAIVNAMIANAAIDSAKIIELSVSKISGGTLGADINVGAGRIVYDNGAFMKVEGVGFGSANQFIEWFGPHVSDPSLCTEAAAIAYLKVDGTSYFGGALLAGVFANSVQATVLNITNLADLGPFSSNGHQITITWSWAFHATTSFAATSGGLSSYNATSKLTPSGTAILSRSLNGGAFADVATLNLSGGFTALAPVVGDSAGSYTQTMGGSSTYVDPSLVAQPREYKLRITAINNVNTTITQNTLAIQSVEH